MKTEHRNYLHFWADLVFKEKAAVIFLMLLLSLVSFSNCYMISEVSKFNKIIDRSHEMHLEGRYFLQIGYSTFSNTPTENKELLNRLLDSKSIEDVTFLNYFSGGGTDGDDINWNTVFFIYNLSDSHVDPTRILSIHDINNVPISSLEVNHVLLDEEAKKNYKVGDHIKLYTYYYDSDTDERFKSVIIDAVIDGFIRRDELVIDTSHTPVDLSLIFTTVYDPTHDTAEALKEGIPGCFCVCSVLSTNGNLINSNEDLPCLAIITPKEGIEQTAFFNDIKQCGLMPQELMSYEQLLDNYLASHKDEIRLIKTLSLAISMLTVCVIITLFVSWYTYKRKELGIFVISGCPWKKAILFSVMPYYFSIVVGGLVGLSGWALYEKFEKIELNVIGWKTAFFLMLSYIFIYSIGVLIYYLMYIRYSPVSLYRDRE